MFWTNQNIEQGTLHDKAFPVIFSLPPLGIYKLVIQQLYGLSFGFFIHFDK